MTIGALRLNTPRPLASGREGPSGRTFHCRVQSIGIQHGGAARATAGLDYDARLGRHAKRADELEVEGGRGRAEMSTILRAAEVAIPMTAKGRPRANGKVALDIEIELPAASSPQHRARIAGLIGGWFEARGCPVHWAIHSHNSAGVYQPHLHATATARPVQLGKIWRQVAIGSNLEGVLEDAAWYGLPCGIRGRPGLPSVIAGPAAMRQFRRDVADIINEETGLDWHGGRLAETGVDRPAKRRLPMAAYKRLHRLDRDRGLHRTNADLDAGNFVIVQSRRRQFVLADQTSRMEAAMLRKERRNEARARRHAKEGAVPGSWLRAAMEDGAADAVQTRPAALDPGPSMGRRPPCFVVECAPRSVALLVFEGEPEPGQAALFSTRTDALPRRLEQLLGRPPRVGEVVVFDRPTSLRRQAEREAAERKEPAAPAKRECAEAEEATQRAPVAPEVQRDESWAAAAAIAFRREAAQGEAERQQNRRIAELEAENARLVELVAGLGVRQTRQEPPTGRQLTTLFTMLKERNLALRASSDDLMTGDVVGATIRRLAEIPRVRTTRQHQRER